MNIRCKHEFVNRCVGLAAFARPLTVAELQYVTFELVTVVAGKEMVELRGKLFLESFHKDKAYRTVVRLESVRED